jgi:sn-glycerol 3-phosphate transport system ATP-binding protein
MKSIRVSELYKSYDQENSVVTDVNFQINEGEFFVLVGPSGCGKSTILRMIAGLETISRGDLFIGDSRANKLTPSERDLSMVFQNYALYPHLSVKENIIFGLHVKKISKKEREIRCKEAADMLQLADYLHRKPRELSGGQRQRVALARAIVSRSPICLMDEPLSNLDAKLRAHMRTEIKQIQRSLGITMVYVTHDQTEAMTMGDRIMVLKDGEVQQIGTPLQVYNKPNNPFVATFIGNPPMNMQKAAFNQDSQELSIEGLKPYKIKKDFGEFLPESILVGIRPESIKLADENTPFDQRFLVEVLNVEILGNDTLIAFRIAGKEWFMRLNGQWYISIGDRIPVTFSYEHVAVFDESTEELLKAPVAKELFSVQKEAVSL